MKTLLLLCFTFSCRFVYAQVYILSFAEAHKQGLTEVYLDSVMRVEQQKYARAKQNGFRNEGTFTRRQSTLSQKIFGVREGAMFHYKLYFSKDAGFNYLVYQIEGKVSEANKRIFLDSLQGLVNEYRASFELNRPHVAHHFLRLGIVRNLPKGDSVISTLETALTTSRPDTVKILALNQLQLKAVPEVIYRFTEMKELNLSGNELNSAYIDLIRLPQLRHIWLNANQLTDTSLHLPENRTLKILNVQGNRFTDLPQAIRNCKKLTGLWLGYNKLTQFDRHSFKGLRRLQDLNLYSCEIDVLPKGITKLRRLEVLDLYYNNLTALPRSLGRMKRLQQLALSHNQLRELPANLGRLKRLYALYAHHNNLTALPGSIGKLRTLRIIDIGHNQFSTLPHQIGSLRSVEDIDVSYNNLSEVPSQLLQLRQLKKLYLRENPFADDSLLLSRSKAVLDSLGNNHTDVSY